CPGADRRAVRRGQGIAGRLLGRRRERGPGNRDRVPGGRRHRVPHGSSADHGRAAGAGAVNAEHRIENLLREFAPQVLGTLVRRHGQFAACEDAVQEALLAAALQWPNEGVPDRPRSWLLTVANRSLVDEWRSESARRRREETLAALEPAADQVDASHWPADQDDTLALLFLCCHPALSPPSQLALTLRAVGGLTTTEIAAAFLVPEATMAKRITRAKQAIIGAGARFELPPRPQRTERLGVVLHVLYLVF